MANWLDLSNNANCFKSIYEKGFVDLSGGSIQTRNEDDMLIIAGDASLNNAYLGEYRSFTRTDTTTNVVNVNITGTVANMISQHDAIDTNTQDFIAISGDGKTVAYINQINNVENLYICKDLGDGNGYTKIVDGFNFPSDSQSQVKLNYDGTKMLLTAFENLQNYGGTDTGGIAIILEYDPTKTNTSSSYLYSTLPASYGPVGWKVMGKQITPPNGTYLGYRFNNENENISISDDGLTIAFGDNWSNYCVYVYTWNGSAWNLKGSTIPAPSNTSNFGKYLSMSGDGDSIISGTESDKHYVFKWDGTSWVQQGGFIYIEGNGQQRGQAINTDGTVIAVGDENSGGIIKIFYVNDYKNDLLVDILCKQKDVEIIKL